MLEIKRLTIFILSCLLVLSGSANARAAQNSTIRLGETGSYQEEEIVVTPDGSALLVEVRKPGSAWVRAFALPKENLYAYRYEARLEICSLNGAWGGLGFGKPEMGFQVLVSQNGSAVLRTWHRGEYQDKKVFLKNPRISFPGKLSLVYDGKNGEIIASWNDEKLFSVLAGGSIGIPVFVTFGRVEVVTFAPEGKTSSSASYGDLLIDLW